jgi:hypothetical protein
VDKNTFLIDLSESAETAYSRGDDFHGQSTPQKVFSAIWALEAEVNNGGFSQYFFNTSNETAGFVVGALETIGAPQTAAICREAISAAFPAGLPVTFEEIRNAAADFPDDVEAKLDALDQKFFQYPHPLTDLLFAYVAMHPKEFGEVPKIEGA